ncbi:hypothetical protein [Methylotuvimicrobium sp. KM2]|uniref:hypothetical protein n=1 Tax=Methylotuvimicrobium sp. KM2 TaxID=3133976 RepID=UPI003100C220
MSKRRAVSNTTPSIRPSRRLGAPYLTRSRRLRRRESRRSLRSALSRRLAPEQGV